MNFEEEKKFEEARKQLVVKRVDAIQLGRNSFTLVEQKAVNYMISKIKPEDTSTTEYIFNIGEFCRMIQWHRTPTQELLNMLQNLANKSWWIKTGSSGNAVYELRHWFDIVRLNEGTGTITITFSQTVQPYLFNLLEQQKMGKIYLASWTADAISLMKNKFSPRLFEQLRSFQFNNKRWEFENGTGSERDLQMIIADRDEKGNPLIPKGWSNWYTFNRDVLKPACDEINKFTDLVIDYEPSKIDFSGKKHRSNVRIVFKMDEKTDEEKIIKDKELAVAYDNVIDEHEYHQLSLLDLADDFDSKRKLARQISEERKREEIINKAIHPVFTEEMLNQGFDENYINHLYDMAKAKYFVCSGGGNKDREELWITDYVSLHLSSLRASGIDTRTNEKARLYDLVENDYKHYAEMLYEQYFGAACNLSHEMPSKPKMNVKNDITANDEELANYLLNKLTK